MNRVFVTGGTGFIGSRLVARLVGAGVSVRVLTRNPSARIGDVDVVHGDICDFDTVARACEGTDTVFHLAGTAHDRAARGDWTRHRVVAVDGARTVIEAAHRAGASRFVFASSLAVFGPVEGGPHDEETPARPASPYGRAKLEAEDVLRTAAARMGMHVAVLRPAMVYGPHCRGNLPRLIRLVDRRFCPQVPDYGTRRSVVHVDHVVEALMLAACRTQAAGQTYIVADKEAYSLRETIDIVARALGRRPKWTVPSWLLRTMAAAGSAASAVLRRPVGFDRDDLAKLTGSAWFTGERIERELQFVPRMTLESAMPELIAAMRAAP